jgi:hypothetical protein
MGKYSTQLKRTLALLSAAWFACISFGSHAQKHELKVLKNLKPIVCYQSNLTSAYHVDTPLDFELSRRNTAGRVKTSNIEVEYINFPDDNLAKNAFQFAVDIWESQLTSSVPIRIRAQWAPLATNVLGQAIWGAAYANFNGAQAQDVYYPVALAEKIAGVELNAASEPDIVATFNSNANWYLATDGKPTSGKMDLSTVVLHEICHGLGFVDSFSSEDGQGSVGLNNVPFVYDIAVLNLSKQSLVSNFISPSSALQLALTSDNLFFNSGLATIGSQLPKLYGPSPFNGGSSVSHLDEAFYKIPGDANNLMTPLIDQQESIHQPGTIALAMLNDMGWISTRIDHAPLKDTERKDGIGYPVKATITSDNGFKNGSVFLNYRTPATETYTSIQMTPTGNPNEFQASLPGTTVNTSYGYYISVEDNLSRTFRNPGIIYSPGIFPSQNIIAVNIGPDTEAPEIVHTPVDYIFDNETQIVINAAITDNIGVASVSLEYQIDGGANQTQVMNNLGSDNFSGTIAVPASLTIGDLIKYRIIARDNSSNSNQSVKPTTNFYTVFVTGDVAARNSYENDFNTDSFDFIGNSFSIETPVNFQNGAIHSEHPYQNGSDANDESNYVYQLQVPIIVSPSNHYIRFDEIVLVEPGEQDSKFGDDDFYDYVVVEGSKNNGITWTPFENGYDARAHSVWFSRYNSVIAGDDSNAAGTSFLFRERQIDILSSPAFAAGNQIKIRFRLFADQAARGWGWAIDNLSIQGAVTGIENADDESLQVFPNPAKDHLTVRVSERHSTVEIYTIEGEKILSTTADENQISIDVSAFPSGIYYLRMLDGDKIAARKFIKSLN